MKKSKYVEIFIREAEEHLEVLRKGFITLEKEGASEGLLNELLRSAHTLKGSANMVDLVELAGIAHRMEDLLKGLQNGEQQFSSDLIDVLLVATDAIEALMAQAQAGGGISVNVDTVVKALESGSIAEQPAKTEEAPDYRGTERRTSVRASVERLDQLVNRMGEILLSQKAMEARQKQMTALLRQLDSSMSSLQGTDDGHALPALRRNMVSLINDFERDRLQLGYQAEDVYQRTMELRLLPLATITDDFERSLRNLARNLKKEVNFIVQGQDVELDRNMLDAVKPILLHVLNNAIDHGIEDPDARIRLGKPKAGQISLHAQYEGSFVQLAVRDDGQGLDPDKIRSTAVKRGVLSTEAAAAMSDDAVIYLVFEPGFSTREFITDVSGRGVGLDVVKSNLDQVKGNLSLRSEPGIGTELVLRLPLSMAIFTGLMVECCGETYVFPQHYIAEVLRISPRDILEEMGREVVRLNGSSIPLSSLSQLFGQEQVVPAAGRLTVLVLSFREQTMGLLVDRTLGLQEVVVKDLGCQLKSLEFFSGSTILGEGTPALIISVADLFAVSQGRQAQPLRATYEKEQRKAKRGRILVVDDSITTRTMEKNILETNNYEVVVAVSGFDALDKLNAGSFDLMVSDVEMPGMTGFELTKKVRQREDTRDLPVIIVTSLASDDHRRQGMEAGAQAYIVKGSFKQGVLLDTVETLIS
ncbi:MAG: hybrid sensor histidine kinase/response regulator [Desulfuromonadales bacterium]|nr:hybrid sensor histidine kinase/response regulator [Desulfuromonadales bacterium]